jgi:polysaccharide export outer membrane protein
MKAKSILLLLAVCFSASAALAQQQDGGSSAPQVPVVNAASSGASSLDSMGVKKYLLGPGDVLDLRVYNEPQFNGALVVNDEGNIEVPFIDQPVPAQCRNDREIRADIVKALAKYLNKPQVSLRVTDMRSRPPAVVFGAVRSPSRVQMMRRVRLLDLIAETGGITEAAGGDVQIFHTEPVMCPEPEDAEVAAASVDSVRATDPTQVSYDIYSVRDLKEGRKEANPLIRPGDIIIVTEAKPVYVTGAVRMPTSLYLQQGMQLKQALAMVGGLTPQAKAGEIVIWRRQKGTSEPQKLVVNYNDIKKEKAKDIDLQPYDIIAVDDNSGSFKAILRGMVMGGVNTGIMNSGAVLTSRIIY